MAGRRLTHLRSLIAELLIAALALQALIPHGYMPGVARDGTPSLVLCSYEGLAGTASTDGQRGSSHDRGAGSGSEFQNSCAFTAATVPLASGSVQLSVLLSDAPVLQPSWPVFQPSASGPLARAHLPRGPPLLS